MANPPEAGCPVTRALGDALRAGGDFARALRRETRLCRACPHATYCRVRNECHQALAGAIREVRCAWETRE